MDRWREGFQDKVYWLYKLESWFILTKFFRIKKYILSQFLYYLFYDFGNVHYEGVQKLQLMSIINLLYFFKFRNEWVIDFGFLLLTF